MAKFGLDGWTKVAAPSPTNTDMILWLHSCRPSIDPVWVVAVGKTRRLARNKRLKDRHKQALGNFHRHRDGVKATKWLLLGESFEAI